MTVITVRAGIVAADRRISYGEDAQAPLCKLGIGQTEDYKYVFAMFGTSEADDTCGELANELVETFKRPHHSGDMGLVILAAPKRARLVRKLIDFTQDGPTKSLIIYGGKHLPEYFARGSGSQAALGSMYSGGTAVSAVRAASAHVGTCGDGLNWVDTTLPLDKWRIRTKRK